MRQRLKGKEGRIRNNLMGKRSIFQPECDYTGSEYRIRSIRGTFENCIKLDVSQVNLMNRGRLTSMVEMDLIHIREPKISYENTTKISISDGNRDMLELEMGDIVNRHLIDGDWVLFNRQPSLHRMSMMGHRVKVMSGNTFRLNVSVTPPYNADFDGDEMNLHAPQSIATRIELRDVMGVKYQIISPRENKPS